MIPLPYQHGRAHSRHFIPKATLLANEKLGHLLEISIFKSLFNRLLCH